MSTDIYTKIIVDNIQNNSILAYYGVDVFDSIHYTINRYEFI